MMRRRSMTGTPAPVPARALALLIALACILFFSSCLSVKESVAIFSEEAVNNGLITRGQAVMLAAAAVAAAGIAESPDPEQEYYIGRSVAATVLAKYPAYDNLELNRYLNLLGQGLALHSSRPEIFAGYRFLALDSMEVNAFATPGGHILVTRGLLRFARSEDELAAVLAHEIAHVTLRHGIDSVKGSRLAELATEVALAAGMSSGGEIAKFTAAFGDAISEIATTLIVSGYSQSYEFQADRTATFILKSSGYDPGALARVLSRMESAIKVGDAGFGATHPTPQAREEALASAAAEGKAAAAPKTAVSGKIAVSGKVAVPPNGDTVESIAPLALVKAERFRAAGAYF